MMNDESFRDSMFELFVFETRQLLEELEQELLQCEKTNRIEGSIDAVFRIMHTIKGSAAMMQYRNISELAHAVEDLFFLLRENKPQSVDTPKIIDLIFEGIDFIKEQIDRAENKQVVDGDASGLIATIKQYVEELKAGSDPVETQNGVQETDNPGPKAPGYEAVIRFEPDCGFEDVQAFVLINNFKEYATDLRTVPEAFVDDEDGIALIKNQGLKLIFTSTLDINQLQSALKKNAFVKEVILTPLAEEAKPTAPKPIIDLGEEIPQPNMEKAVKEAGKSEPKAKPSGGEPGVKQQSLISVNVNKLDLLLDLVGELVISEAMVTRHPELEGLPLDNFHKAARQLRKITNELQDLVMSIRMVPLAATFQKMHRIVRDMSRKLGKEVHLKVVGEETEVDKNIIEHISDPLMHLIRNAMDHGIETAEERRRKNKPAYGTVTLEAKSAGSDVLIEVRDDGRGLNRERILEKAKQNGLLTKDEAELSDRDVFGFILLPGFSTKEEVTEFSGRGVGMDVVVKEIHEIGGTVLIDSTPDVGTVFTLKIPLTLAIIDGITVRGGKAKYSVPTTSIRESFQIKAEDLITDPDGNEMIMIRGQCYPVLRLHQLFNVQTHVTRIDEGVIVMVENNEKGLCLFVDELLGEQQVVVKALPKYIKKVRGIAGCTLLGDGSISLILDVPGLIQMMTA